MLRSAPPALAVFMTLCSAARADWVPADLGGEVFYTHVVALDDQHLVVAGAQVWFDTSGMFPVPKMRRYLRKSVDGGASFTSAHPTLSDSDMQLTPISALTFIDPEHGWFALGSDVHYTVDGGATWNVRYLGYAANDLHFRDAANGFAVGPGGSISRSYDGGAAWMPIGSPTAVELRRQFWLDAQHGWIAGSDERLVDDGQGGQTPVYEHGVVLVTSDGGNDWELGASVPELALGKLWFVDSQTGWLAASAYEDADNDQARLLKTSDGGLTFSDANLPLEVGRLSMGNFPVLTSWILTMHWSDAQHGHLAGTAFVVKIGSSGGGGNDETKIWRNVDYRTEDGGATWQKTDLGVLQLDLQNQVWPASDGQMIDGDLACIYQGYLVGEASSVYRYAHVCGANAHCCPGERCIQAECVPDPSICTPACPPGWLCEFGQCVPDYRGDLDRPQGGDDDQLGKLIDDGCGCQAQAGEALLPSLLGLLAMLGLGRLTRRAGGRPPTGRS